jgi:hypothetical protein
MIDHRAASRAAAAPAAPLTKAAVAAMAISLTRKLLGDGLPAMGRSFLRAPRRAR